MILRKWFGKKVDLKKPKIINGNRFGVKKYSDDLVERSIQELWEEITIAKKEIQQLEVQCGMNKRAIEILEKDKLERLKNVS